MSIGAQCSGNSCTFTVWAPFKNSVAVHLLDPDRIVAMERQHNGYWSTTIDNCGAGALYRYRLDDDLERPDPASYCQPQGVHGPSMVIDFSSSGGTVRNRIARNLNDYIIYELHIGTFTPEGTFEAAAEKVEKLSRLGITAIEIMPVSQFPGKRNWGYDGVYPFAVQHSYGGVDGLRSLVESCHQCGIAVILDVVYNHLGPEGNYLRDFAPYFTDRYHTPWGEGLNFDGPYSDEVVAYFIENACYWFREFSIDALRLDAVHAIFDVGARPFLQRLSERIEHEFGTDPLPRYLIAESDLNDGRIIQDRKQYGMGMHAQWSDDFHHVLHTILTNEKKGYYQDFGAEEQLVQIFDRSFAYAGEYAPSRKRTHGNNVRSCHTGKFVVCSQNHDQIGNRMMGERLLSLTDFRRAGCAAAAVLLSPYIPLLFMGEEHGEKNPFLYFADHGDNGLVQAVREGRKKEFAGFFSNGEPFDPFSIDTYRNSQINWDLENTAEGEAMLRLFSDCIHLRQSSKAIGPGPREAVCVHHTPGTRTVALNYHTPDAIWLCIFNFDATTVSFVVPFATTWTKQLDIANYLVPPENTALPQTLDDTITTLTLSPFACAVYKHTINQADTK